MSIDDKKIWGIHTKNDSLFINENLIGIGWDDYGNASTIQPSREAFKERYSQVYKDAKPMSIANSAGMIYRFVHEIEIGDYVIFPAKIDRQIYIGEIVSDYNYEADAPIYRNRRKVKWLKVVPRTSFSQAALYEIGSFLTLFTVKNNADEFMAVLQGKTYNAYEEDDTIGVTAEDIIENTKDFILKELSRQLKGYDLEDFVANLLQAMGYRTKVSANGGDSGIDIIAYKDELPPRILVQVKSVDGDIKESVLQSLKGAMREGDYGLFVTLSNYTKNALNYLDNTPIIRGINGTELVELVLKYYDQLDDRYQDMIPLKKVYIPVLKTEE
ncbi:restriction system protein [Pseudobutyrivibrio sp. ACV-2]|uniref:restriction endonuclease n=1 Tax=Pseudobutyrivibrio sp. ACV-2 TaxID=1520801 RepID=UPI0008942E22|nr:restriction endonuclease [Pseudobutyrivibrio sp. ACV-2]SEA88893.1 restriction system protein [Pseudobutyrivibrio sp. ACV-2]